MKKAKPLGGHDSKSWTHRKVDGNHVFGINAATANTSQRSAARTIALIKGVEVADFELTFDVKSTKDTGGHATAACFSTADAEHFYCHFGANPDPHGQIMIVKNAPRKAMTNNKNKTPWKNETWHKIKVVRNSKKGTIRCFDT